MIGYSLDQLIETHLERMARAGNGSYQNEKATYCSDNAENYRKLAGVYASQRDRRKVKEMKKLAKGWSKMATACLANAKIRISHVLSYV